jgi:CRISPR-associated protein Cmr2
MAAGESGVVAVADEKVIGHYDVFARYRGREAADFERIWNDSSLDLVFRMRLLGLSMWSDFLTGLTRRLYSELLTKRQRTVGDGLGVGKRYAEALRLARPLADVGLPADSWCIEMPVRLASPYFSRDDAALYVVDNPVRKDRTLGLPMVAASGWKGNLRSAGVRYLESLAGSAPSFVEARTRVALLFGDEKGLEGGEESRKGDMSSYLRQLGGPEAQRSYIHEMQRRFPTDEDEPDGFSSHQGRVHFYSTLFDRLGLQIINPHDRRRRVGTNPILFEVVPAGATGWFTLLYYPVDLMGQSRNVRLREMAADLRFVARLLVEMFRSEGFSAKKTSGFGLVEDRLAGDGVLRVAVGGAGEMAPLRTYSLSTISGLEAVADAAASEVEGAAHGQ